jgi:hypothetical protein
LIFNLDTLESTWLALLLKRMGLVGAKRMGLVGARGAEAALAYHSGRESATLGGLSRNAKET